MLCHYILGYREAEAVGVVHGTGFVDAVKTFEEDRKSVV